MRLNLNLGGLWQPKVKRKVTAALQQGKPTTTADMVKEVRRAQNEWEAAKHYFQAVSEPDRVDHAIFTLQAAERKYMFLLNELKARAKAGGEQNWT